MYDVSGGGGSGMIWIIVIVILFLLIWGAFTSESFGCGTCLVVLLLFTILWWLGGLGYVLKVLKFMFNLLSKLLM